MRNPNTHQTIRTTCCNNHAVQFYRSEEFLIGSLNEFILDGVAKNEAVVLLATAVHRQQLQERLGNSANQKVYFIDAHQALEQVLTNGEPDQKKFNTLLEAVLRDQCQQWPKVRFFGELVNLLSAKGDIDKAEILESFWNEFLLNHEGVSLLCGYDHQHVHNQNSFQQVCDAHSDVISSEEFTPEKLGKLEQQLSLMRTELREKELMSEELRKLKEQLVSIARLTTLGELYASLAHEISNPLSIILSSIEQLKAENSANQIILGRLEKSAQRIEKISGNALKLARSNKSEMKTFSVNKIMSEAIGYLQEASAWTKDRIQVSFAPVEVFCYGDEGKISQVFLNLLTNARDALDTAYQKQAGQITITIGNTPSLVIVTVKDDGFGMTEEVRRNIFTPFFTTKAEGRGTGLGLSIAKSIVLQHRGSITCESIINKGTLFTVKLPSFYSGT